MLAAMATLAACEPDYYAPPRNSEEKAMAAQCEADGGQFSRTGFDAQIVFCKMPERPAKDAGKMCTDGSQCEAGNCLAETKSCAPVVNAPFCEPVLIQGERVVVECPD